MDTQVQRINIDGIIHGSRWVWAGITWCGATSSSFLVFWTMASAAPITCLECLIDGGPIVG